jgi:hypothetical protein
MLTEQNLKNVFDILTNDESFCRLVFYGEEPFSENKTDVTSLDNYKDLFMDNYIFFSPQIEDLGSLDTVRICLFKDYTKLRNLSTVVRHEAIQFDIYVPHRLQKLDMRIYKLENKIANLLDKMPMNIGYLDYIDGSAIPLPPIQGYALYRMVFRIEDTRPINGKY